jgi:glycosyltransferase involved in cell wall biosynthesis
MTPADPAVSIDTGRGGGERPPVVMALPACGGRAIGDNALRRAVAISAHFRPVVVSDSFPGRMPEGVETILVTPPRFHYLRRFCHVPNELGFAWAVRKALTTLQRRKGVAFLLCHGYTLTWFTGRWFRRRTGVPFGMFMHGHIFERPKGTYDPRLTAFYRTIAPSCYREADLLFALSPKQGDLAVHAGARPDRVVLAPNGLDLVDIGLDPKAARRKAEDFLLHRPLRLLYIGRFAPEKGVDVVLQACAALRSRGGGFRLTLIGEGPEDWALRSLVNKFELDDHCTFLGAIPRSRLGSYLLEHDLLVVPSLSEPLGNVVLEGMAGACLVVASNTGGIPSMVEHGVTGLLFPAGNSQSLLKLFVVVDEERVDAARMVRNAFEWLDEHSSWSAIGERIAAAIDPLVREGEQNHGTDQKTEFG